MPAILKKQRIAYFPVPKIACSSFKHMFFTIENGFAFRQFRANGEFFSVHSFYRSTKFSQSYLDSLDGYWSFAIVRDPVKRLVSAYANRVIHYRELDPWALGDAAREHDVPTSPDLGTFIEHFETYRKISGSIRHHTNPIGFYLGPDLGAFDAVFPIEKLDEAMEAVNARLEEPVELPHVQTGGPRIPVTDLTRAQVDRLREFYAGDYALLSGIYD